MEKKIKKKSLKITQLPTLNYKIKYKNMLICKTFECKIPFGIECYKEKKIINIEIDTKIYNEIIELEKIVQDNLEDMKLTTCARKKPTFKPLLRTHLKYDKNNNVKLIIIKNEKRIKYDEHSILKKCSVEIDIYLKHIWCHKDKIGLLWMVESITLI